LYLDPGSLDFSLDEISSVDECGRGRKSSAVISWRGFCDSGSRNWSRKREPLEGYLLEAADSVEESMSDWAF
jgi:hypothetical protein